MYKMRIEAMMEWVGKEIIEGKAQVQEQVGNITIMKVICQILTIQAIKLLTENLILILKSPIAVGMQKGLFEGVMEVFTILTSITKLLSR